EPPRYLTGAVMRRLPAMPPARPGAWLAGRGRSVRWLVGIGCAAAQIVGLWGAYRCGYARAEQRRPAARPAVRGTLATDRFWAARPVTPAGEPALRRRAAAVPLAAQPVR